MIKVNGRVIKVEHYPDGTQKINLGFDPTKESYHEITWLYEKEEELATLIYITRHLRDSCGQRANILLKMPYLPNARMDRIHDRSEVFTLKAFAEVINWLDFSRVLVADVHSNVGTALLDKVEPMILTEIFDALINWIDDRDLILYFPDAGAAKRYKDLVDDKKLPYCYGEKVRDWETGTINGLEIRGMRDDFKGKTVLMIDDIISYGGSLYYSALKLKELGIGKIYAYATHTENSVLDPEKGTLIKLLRNGTIEKLYTTNSIYSGNEEKIEIAGDCR